MKLHLFLANRGHEDLGQYPDLPVYGTPLDYMVECDDLDDAERKVHQYMIQHCLQKKNFIGGHVMLAGEMMGYFTPDGNFWNRSDANFCIKKTQLEQLIGEVKVKRMILMN